jgi:hypothetical protein
LGVIWSVAEVAAQIGGDGAGGKRGWMPGTKLFAWNETLATKQYYAPNL